MSKTYLLEQYKQDIEEILKDAKNRGLNNNQVNHVLKESFEELKHAINHNKSSISHNNAAQYIKRNALKLFTIFIFLFCIFLYILLNTHTATSSIVLRNVQGLAYPALKLVRTVSVPVLKLFPALTDIYDESCLIENPYFYVSDMECWPCEQVCSVVDVTGLLNEYSDFNELGEGVPFIAKTNQPAVNFDNVRQLYANFSNEINLDSRRFSVISDGNIRNLPELLRTNETNLSSNFHAQWRINKMTTSRIIRKLFQKPYFLPDRSGQAVERFVIIDGPNSAPYKLPNTECSYVFIIQGTGERTINLIPSNECKRKCKNLSVVLKPSYLLMYNWWYWRPISLPLKNATSLSISYINSYC